MANNYQRTIDELETKSVLWWPTSLSVLEKNSSIIPKLIATQEKFLAILTLSEIEPYRIFDIITTTGFPANLFLKHLVVLSDFGGEQIQRVNQQFKSVFGITDGKYGFDFFWNSKEYRYIFKALPQKSNLNNVKLGIDGEGLKREQPLDDLKKDMIAILLFGANSINEATASALSKCEIGGLLGKQDELTKYVKEKYIWVSRVTGGAQSNTLGQIAQSYVLSYLSKGLGSGYILKSNGTVEVGNGSKPFAFDIVVSKGKCSIGIEISFQVTTNSVIERKSSQARTRQETMHSIGNYVAYIIDGAGNFARKSAVAEICRNSDCTVAYKDNEFDLLLDFIKEKTSV